MRFEYFQMIDRIAALDVGERTVRSVCIVPKQSTISKVIFRAIR